jgi:short-subunit dehydrogenase
MSLSATRTASSSTPGGAGAPQFLVNNAGFGLLGRAIDLAAEQLAMVDLNTR